MPWRETGETQIMKPSVNLPERIYRLTLLSKKLGRLGKRMEPFLQMYALYVIFTNGGVESLAVICHEYIIKKVEKEQRCQTLTLKQKSAPTVTRKSA